MNGWIPTCVVKHFELSVRLEKELYICNPFSIKISASRLQLTDQSFQPALISCLGVTTNPFWMAQTHIYSILQSEIKKNGQDLNLQITILPLLASPLLLAAALFKLCLQMVWRVLLSCLGSIRFVSFELVRVLFEFLDLFVCVCIQPLLTLITNANTQGIDSSLSARTTWRCHWDRRCKIVMCLAFKALTLITRRN